MSLVYALGLALGVVEWYSPELHTFGTLPGTGARTRLRRK
jgi:hypothetical protein